MISKEYKKHGRIVKPLYGNFNRNEWAVIGSSDSIIKDLSNAVMNELSPFYKCAYVASLQDDEKRNALTTNGVGFAEFNNHENFYSFNYNKTFNRFGLRQMFADADIVIVNGNLQQAKAQVIVINTSTQKKLQEGLAMLTNVQLILLADHEENIFDFVKQAIPYWQELPVYRIDEISKISAFFQAQLKRARPVLKGLVLAGGKSTRMGSDKGSIAWHGTEQRYYMAELLQKFCDDVFISCRHDQQNDIAGSYKTIEDSFTGLGPYGAILSAFREQPDCAWLVAACDMPLLNAGTFQYLIEQRHQSAMATTFESPLEGFPEPLITIWEPKSYPVLLSMLAQGYTCPRKALENNDVCILKAPYPDALMNVNTPEEKEKAKNILKAASQE